MRLRNVPGARETIIENQFSIQQPEQMKGKWAEVFQNDHPIHIEVYHRNGKKKSRSKLYWNRKIFKCPSKSCREIRRF